MAYSRRTQKGTTDTKGVKQRPLIRGYRRATFYLTPEMVRDLKIRAAQEDRDLSDLVREAIRRFLEEK